MDYRQFIKRLDLPPGFAAPEKLTYEDLEARAITRSDLRDDVFGINAGIALIKKTRCGEWPTEPVTEERNFVDLVWHELEFREGYSFTYAVFNANGRYLGCCYLYPMGRRTELNEELLQHDVDVSWWVTPDAYERGYYTKLCFALRHWLADEFPFRKAYFSNSEVPDKRHSLPEDRG
jgi:RimJ/RimL family protein N-acetyltransferase